MHWPPVIAFLSHILIAYASYIVGHSWGTFFEMVIQRDIKNTDLPIYDHQNSPSEEPQEGTFSTDQIKERRNLLQVN